MLEVDSLVAAQIILKDLDPDILMGIWFMPTKRPAS